MREPSRTVTTGGAAGAVVVIAIYLVSLAWPHIEVPAEVAAAATLIVSVIGAWIVPDPKRRPNAKH